MTDPDNLRPDPVDITAISKILQDVIGIAGAVLIAGGIGLIFPPAGIIAVGVLMLTFAILAARNA